MKGRILFSTFLILFEVQNCFSIGDHLVKTSHGDLIPAVKKSRSGREFYAFLGIPYGAPPVNNLRYQPPSKVAHWGVRNATSFGHKCIQYNIVSSKVEGDEDCLYMNIYTPKIPEQRSRQELNDDEDNSLMPVIVFIHPGAFMFDSSNDYGGEYFMDQDVVLVTFNFRLGSFGFLNTGDTEAQGNMGMKDQVMVLKWVQEEIAKFGGNKNFVTLFGDRSGGASVHYHMISKMSKGLFHRAISSSGSAFCPWAFDRIPRRSAKRLGMVLNCPTSNTQDLVGCLKNFPAEIIAQKHSDLFEWGTDPINSFAPSVEVTLNEDDVFLDQSPYLAYRSKSVTEVPWIIGVNDNEGMMAASSILGEPKSVRDLNTEWTKLAPICLYYRHTAIDSDAVSHQIRSHYFGPHGIRNETAQGLSDMFSDRYHIHCTRFGALLQAKANEAMNVYLYLFGFTNNQSYANDFNNINMKGVSEGDELQHFFKIPYFSELKQSAETIDFSSKLIKLWTSFARTGNTEGTWGAPWTHLNSREVNGDVRLQYYKLDQSPQMYDEPFLERMTFWDNLPLNENRDVLSRRLQAPLYAPHDDHNSE